MLPLKRISNDQAPTGVPNRSDGHSRTMQWAERGTRQSSRITFDPPLRIVDVVVRSAAFAAGTFSHIALAACSTLTAEFLAGCAAYAHATYPYHVQQEETEASTVRERTSLGWDRDGSPETIQTLRSVSRQNCLRVEKPAAHRPRWPLSQPTFAAHSSEAHVAALGLLRSYPTRAWYASISAMAVLLWNLARERRAMYRAMIELDALDDRTLRDIGLSRFDIARVVRSEIDLR